MVKFRKKESLREWAAAEKGVGIVDPGDPEDMFKYKVLVPMSGMTLAHIQNIVMYLIQKNPQVLQDTAPFRGSLQKLTEWLSTALEEMGTDLKFEVKKNKRRVGISTNNEIKLYEEDE